MLKVRLLQYTPEPERTIALAARLCYSPAGVEKLDGSLSAEQVGIFIRKLLRLGHFSALEHAAFTFAAEGLSRVATHQLVRHRIASYSQQSQRYVAERNFAAVLPPSVAAKAAAAAK
jgi:thymidylate synthase (FAD)